MNQEQMKAAEQAMSSWLAHPQELGKAPAKIVVADEFDLDGLHYYIFKFKKTLLGKWLIGVCGGYEGDSFQNSGNIFSEMKEFNEETAKDDALKLVEMVKNYWKIQAANEERKKEQKGNFVDFVLLKEAAWDKNTFLDMLKEDWNIKDNSKATGDADKEDIAILSYKGAMISVAYLGAPVPNGEAEQNAVRNFLWKGAVDAAKEHKAHLAVVVMGRQLSAKEAGILHAKVVATCCKLENAVGVYARGTVLEPKFCIDCAQVMYKDMYPILNLVWFGLYRNDNGFSAYTNGLSNFGLDEIEILNSGASPEELRQLLIMSALYVVENNVNLEDGQTIGFAAKQKFPISKGRGVAVPGNSVKIML